MSSRRSRSSSLKSNVKDREQEESSDVQMADETEQKFAPTAATRGRKRTAEVVKKEVPEDMEGELEEQKDEQPRKKQRPLKTEQPTSVASSSSSATRRGKQEEEDDEGDEGEGEVDGDDDDVEALAAQMGMSVYEYQRQENIRLKNEQLQMLNLAGMSGELGLKTRAPVARVARPKVKREPQVGMRRSSRSSVRDPNYVAPPPIYVPEITNSESYRQARKEGTLTWKEAVPGGEAGLEEEEEKAYKSVFKAFENALLISDKKYPSLEQASIEAYRAPGAISQAKLKMLGNTNYPHMKMVKSRTTSVRVHPTASLNSDISIVAAGDKDGRVGIAKYSNVAPSSTWHDTFVVAQFSPHVNSIVDLHWSSLDSHKLYSASRDGSVRCFDVSSLTWMETFVADEEYGGSVSGLGLAPDHRSVLVCDRDGLVHMVDVRVPVMNGKKKSSHPTYQCGSKAINGCALNPQDPNMLATGGLDRVVRVWDIRKFVADKPIREWTHTQAINGVSFSSSGNHLVSTSYDNTLKLFSCINTSGQVISADRWLPPAIIRHDNQTGRWVSRFKAFFAPGDVALGIGNMKRFVDVIPLVQKGTKGQPVTTTATVAAAASSSSSASKKKPNGDDIPQPPPIEGSTISLSHGEWVTTIPAAVAWHPTRVQIVGGTGSGRLYVYGER